MDIKTKLQLRWYSGPGIGYMMDTLLPRMLHHWFDLSPLVAHVGSEAVHSIATASESPSTTCTNTNANVDTKINRLQKLPYQFTDKEVRALFCDNLFALLRWYHPPEAVELPVETMPCHICGRLFVPGDHYSKFSFVYCSSACLGKHRKVDFK
jgi:hypothetical protein